MKKIGNTWVSSQSKPLAALKPTRQDERKFLLASAKGGATQRKVNTAKLPTTLEEWSKR